mgnify:CR=1 FL=1
MKKAAFMVIILLFCLSVFGCAGLREMCAGFKGVSIKALEEARKDAIARHFNYDYFTAYSKSLDALKQMQAYVYKQDIKQHIIAIYVSQTDTTPVGIFFQEVNKDTTKIEVSSLSSYAKDLIAKGLFNLLEAKLPPVK